MMQVNEVKLTQHRLLLSNLAGSPLSCINRRPGIIFPPYLYQYSENVNISGMAETVFSRGVIILKLNNDLSQNLREKAKLHPPHAILPVRRYDLI